VSEDLIRGGMSARPGLRDAFSLQGVDQARRITHEQHGRPSRGGADHSQLEPFTEAGHRRAAGAPAGWQEPVAAKVREEGVELRTGAAALAAAGTQPQP
jgi:hypothetical protein